MIETEVARTPRRCPGHPAGRDGERHRFQCYDLPDHVILQPVLNRRKQG
jgi:hypothetical protein